MLFCVCEKCEKVVSDAEGASPEINFKLKSILYVCPNCKHQNVISWKPATSAFPRTKVMR